MKTKRDCYEQEEEGEEEYEEQSSSPCSPQLLKQTIQETAGGAVPASLPAKLGRAYKKNLKCSSSIGKLLDSMGTCTKVVLLLLCGIPPTYHLMFNVIGIVNCFYIILGLVSALLVTSLVVKALASRIGGFTSEVKEALGDESIKVKEVVTQKKEVALDKYGTYSEKAKGYMGQAKEKLSKIMEYRKIPPRELYQTYVAPRLPSPGALVPDLVWSKLAHLYEASGFEEWSQWSAFDWLSLTFELRKKHIAMIKFLEILLTSESPKEAETIYRSMAEKGPAPGEYPVATNRLFKKNAILGLMPKALQAKVEASKQAMAGETGEAQDETGEVESPRKALGEDRPASAQSNRKSTGEGSASSEKKIHHHESTTALVDVQSQDQEEVKSDGGDEKASAPAAPLARNGSSWLKTPEELAILEKYEKRVKLFDLKVMLHQPSDVIKMMISKQMERYVPQGMKALGRVPRKVVRLVLLGASAFFLFLLKSNATIRKWSVTLAKAFVLVATAFALMISGLLYSAQSYCLKREAKKQLAATPE